MRACRRVRWNRPLSPAAAGTLALLAGVIWVAIALHQRAAHGPTEANEMRLVLGTTWMDSGKFLAVPPLLLIPAALHLRSRAPSRLASAAFAAFGGILAVFAVTALLQFLLFPWGSYAQTFEEAGVVTIGAGIVQAFSTLGLFVAWLVGAIPAGRAAIVPWWLVVVVAAGTLATVFLTPASLFPAAAWVALGAWLYRDS